MEYYSQVKPGRILLISENEANNVSIVDLFEEKGHYYEMGSGMQDIIEKVSAGKFDLVIIDIVYLINYNSQILRKIKKEDPDVDIILITGSGLVNIAVQFMKNGVYDFITRPINSDYLAILIQKAMERRELVKAARERDVYRHLTNIDGLTGLYNHKFFQEQLNRQIDFSKRKHKNFSLLMMDLDDFKQINDSYGHQAGDEILRKVSLHIAENCRKYDTIARYGGEEFSVILPGISAEHAKNVAERICTSIANSQYGIIDRSVTASIGISLFPYHSQEKEDLLKKADAALYYSKENGKNTYTIYYPECDATLV